MITLSISKKSKVHSLKSKVYGLRSCPAKLSAKHGSVVSSPHSAIRNPRSQAFTLMELLVVLAVIGLLIGLLFPALMGARERSRITRASSEIQTLQQAWLAYWNTYGQTLGWPSVARMDAGAVAILGGDDSASAANPQGISFMEFDERHYDEGFKDPWGNEYRIDFGSGAETFEKDWMFETRVHCINTARYKY